MFCSQLFVGVFTFEVYLIYVTSPTESIRARQKFQYHFIIISRDLILGRLVCRHAYKLQLYFI